MVQTKGYVRAKKMGGGGGGKARLICEHFKVEALKGER